MMFRMALAVAVNRKCFKACIFYFLRSQQEQFLTTGKQNRRRELLSMMSSGSQFYFDGRRVCKTFLSKAFHSSDYMQNSARSRGTMLMHMKAASISSTTPPGQSLRNTVTNMK